MKKSSSSLRCSVCRAEFSRADARIRHEKIHQKKKLICPFRTVETKCQATFYRIDDLKSHLEHHNDPKYKSPAFSCDICSKVFISNIQLEKHKNVHPNPRLKTFCSRCNKGFKNAHGLRVHSCPLKKAKNLKISNSMKKFHQTKDKQNCKNIDRRKKKVSEETE